MAAARLAAWLAAWLSTRHTYFTVLTAKVTAAVAGSQYE
jgi:hypothetical protein